MRKHGRQYWFRAHGEGDWSEWRDWNADQGWWTGQSSGWAWRGFARRMFLSAVVLLAFGMVSLILIGAALAALVGSGWVAAVLAPVVVFGLGLIMAGWVVGTWRPVSQLISAAGRLADGDYSVRVAPAGSASMRPVAASFNDMARRLETADEQRRRLLADLGHELRTPLTVIRGELEAIVDGIHSPDDEHMELLLDEVRVMERLLEDLKTLSLAEAGALALHPEPTDVADLVADVAESYRRVAEGQNVALEFKGDETLPEMMVDPVRIREVITNLVVNGLKAMPDGGNLTLTFRPSDAGYEITVRDTGMGIDPSELLHVFERFHKGTTSTGTGLGLTISRDLIEAHGGSISIESIPDAGTTVTVSLPARAARPTGARRMDEP